MMFPRCSAGFSAKLCLLTMAMAVAALPAQSSDGPYWGQVPLPANLVGPIAAVGSIVAMRTSTEVLVWTGIHRRWTAIPASSAAVVQNSFNDMLLVVEGGLIRAFSARTGTVDVLAISPSAVLDVGPPFSSWTAAVRDGATVSAYSAFRGRWVTQALASQSATLGVGTHVALAHDGVSAYAFSTFHGTWVSTPAGADAVPSVGATSALLVRQNEVIGFAGQTNGWSRRAWASAGSATVTAQRGYHVLTNLNEALFFSGYTQSFETYVGLLPLGLIAQSEVAALIDLDTVACFAAAPGSLAVLTAIGPAIQGGEEVLLVNDAGTLHAFSGATGRFAPPLAAASAASVFRSVATAITPQGFYAYSLLSDSWSLAPSVVPSQTTLLRDGVVLSHAGGWSGFSARSAAWHDHVGTPGTIVNHDATFTSTSGQRVDHFDTVRGRWSSVLTQGAPNVVAFRTVTIVEDGFQAFGYGLSHGTWESIALPAIANARRASSECGYVTTATDIFPFAGYGSLTNFSRFPEFTRFAIAGAPIQLRQVGLPSSDVLMGVSTVAAEVNLPGLGVLELDLSATTLVPLGLIPASGLLELDLPLPRDPALQGVTFHVQNLVLPLAGPPVLTNAIHPVIL